jgi:hypothetical protein
LQAARCFLMSLSMTQFYLGFSPLIAPHDAVCLKVADNHKQIMVEAAGVEPASEKARREKNYVRFRFGDCRPPH